MNVSARDLQALFDVGPLGTLPDDQLLDRFVRLREEAVFEAIVRRHGPMVWSVCRRILRDHHDAEDAVQATFLVLARKAPSIMIREKLGHWLHGVAYQTARKARATALKRESRRRPMTDQPEPSREPSDERLAILDREVSRLPAKYRIPIVCCELEGMSHREAAEQLGWPIGTVSGRLSRARAILARRISRPGRAVSVGSLAILLFQDASASVLPDRLIVESARSGCLFAAGGGMKAGVVPAGVVALAEEVLKAMLFSKIKVVAVALLMVVVVGTVGAFFPPKQDVARVADRPEEIGAKLPGFWTGVVAEIGGHRAAPADNVPLPGAKVRIRGDELTLKGLFYGNIIGYSESTETTFKFKVDASKEPNEIDLTLPEAPDDLVPTTHLGLIRLEGDELLLCLSIPNKKRPVGFKTREKTMQMLLKLKKGGAESWDEAPKLLEPAPDQQKMEGPPIQKSTVRPPVTQKPAVKADPKPEASGSTTSSVSPSNREDADKSRQFSFLIGASW